MSRVFQNLEADNLLQSVEFSGSEQDSYEDTLLKWDTPVDYSIYLMEGLTSFKLLKDGDAVEDNLTYTGSSYWVKNISSMNFFKLDTPFNTIFNSPGYGDEFIGNAEDENKYTTANQYTLNIIKRVLSLLEDSGYKDIKGVIMYKGNTYIEENNILKECSFIVPLFYVSLYYKGRVISSFFYKNGLVFTVEYNYGKNDGNTEELDNLVKDLNEKIKYVFNEQTDNS